MDEQPLETRYTEAEVLVPMEAEAVETVAALSDFPGFESRSWEELPCSHNGIDDVDYVNVEIRYGFSDLDSADPLVRGNYVDALRERWTELGYDIHRDEATPSGNHHAIEARRDDGINLWYRVAEGVSLMIQSGCVPKSDPSDIEYIPPAGGLVPGSKWDTPIEGIQGLPEAPVAESSDEATESVSPSGMLPPWARDPDPAETGVNPYDDHL